MKKILLVILTFAIVLSAVCVTFANDNVLDMSALIADTSAWQFTGTASNDGKKIGLSGAFETAGYAKTLQFETLEFKSTLVVPWGNWGRINFRQDNAMSVPWALQNTYSFEMQYSGITLYKWLNGSYEALGSTTYNIIGDDAAGTEHAVKITVKNNSDGSVNIVMAVDGSVIINVTDSKNPITSHGQLSFQIGGNGRFDISGIKPAGGDPGDDTDDKGNVVDIFTLIADDANWTLGGTATNNGEKINTPGPFDVAGYTKNAEFDTLKLKTKLIAEYGCFGLITVRTDSPAVGMWAINNGYSFQIMSTGITLIKFAATQQTALATSSVNLVGDTVHELKIKIKNNDDGSVNIVLNADGTEVINATDSTNPYTEHGQLGFQASAAGTFEISGTPYDIPETKLIDITLKDKATGNAVTEINNGMTVYADGEILQGVEGNVYLYTAVFDGERLVDCYFTSAKAEKGTVSSPNITLSFEQEQRNDYVIKVFALNAPYSKPICAPAIFPFAQ